MKDKTQWVLIVCPSHLMNVTDHVTAQGHRLTHGFYTTNGNLASPDGCHGKPLGCYKPRKLFHNLYWEIRIWKLLTKLLNLKIFTTVQDWLL